MLVTLTTAYQVSPSGSYMIYNSFSGRYFVCQHFTEKIVEET